MSIYDLPVVVFHQTIKEVEVVPAEYEQSSYWCPISQIHDLSAKHFSLTRRIHTDDPGNCSNCLNNIALFKLVTNSSMLILGIIIVPMVLSG